jgi:glycosyltransferase involved in cell wall biosynthesis
MSLAKKIVKKIVPPHTLAGRFVKKNAAKVGLANPLFFNDEYNNWIANVEPQMFLPAIKDEIENINPLFSIVIPFFNTPDKYLHPLIDSIQNQVYQNWELIVADGSTDEERSSAIKEISGTDNRFVYYKLPKNLGISGNTNQALEKIKGRYVVFADHDDELNPHALNEVAVAIQKDQSIDILYSDEDKITDNGRLRHSPLFKPDWSPQLFLYTNYTNHLSVIRSSLVQDVGGLRPELDGSQDYDLLLRVHTIQDEPLNVHHIPKILYHWREAAGSTAVDYSRKSYAFEAGRRALQEYLDRRNLKGKVISIRETPGFFKQEFEIPQEIKTVKVCVNVSRDVLENRSFIAKLESGTRSKLRVEFATKVLSSDTQDVFVEINDTCLPLNYDWLDSLVGVLGMSDVMTVSPRILSPDRQNIYDMGIVLARDGSEIRLNSGLDTKDLTIGGGAQWVRNVDKPSGKVVIYRHKKQQSKNSVHHVIWSHVDFVHYPVFGVKTFFNANLQVNDDARITVNDK